MKLTDSQQKLIDRIRRLLNGDPAQCIYHSENAITTAAAKREDKESALRLLLEIVDAGVLDKAAAVDVMDATRVVIAPSYRGTVNTVRDWCERNGIAWPGTQAKETTDDAR